MITTLEMNDGRVLARIIHLAHRFGCTYTRAEASHSNGMYAMRVEFAGPTDALRRLAMQINKLTTDDKETFG